MSAAAAAAGTNTPRQVAEAHTNFRCLRSPIVSHTKLTLSSSTLAKTACRPRRQPTRSSCPGRIRLQRGAQGAQDYGGVCRRTFDFFLRIAVTSEFTTGNLAPTVPSFAVMSVNSVRCAASEFTACAPRRKSVSALHVGCAGAAGTRRTACAWPMTSSSCAAELWM